MFNLINLIFDRLADSIKPFTGVILQILPQLWQESEGQSLLRIQVRTFLPIFLLSISMHLH